MDGNVSAVILIFGTPLVAIIGGIFVAVVKTKGQQRLMELAQRERIAAIEKGLDVSQLPAPGVPALTWRQMTLRRVQGLIIGGLLTLAIGIGLSVMLLLLPASDGREAWSVGFVPLLIGAALLISSRLVRRSLDEE